MGITEEHCLTLTAGDRHAVALCLNDQGGAVMSAGKVAATLRAESHNHEPIVIDQVYEAHNQDGRYSGPLPVAPTVTQYFGTGGGNVPLVKEAKCYVQRRFDDYAAAAVASTLTRLHAHDVSFIKQGSALRRLTPVECERLQGFPDGWTDIPFRNQEHAADSLRYKALGNSMAVPCMRWIGERIAMTEAEKYENDL